MEELNPVQRLDRLMIERQYAEGLIELYGRMRRIAQKHDDCQLEFRRVDLIFDILIRRMMQANPDGEMTRERIKKGWQNQPDKPTQIGSWEKVLEAVMEAVTRAAPGRRIYLGPDGRVFASRPRIKGWSEDYARELWAEAHRN